MLNKIILLSAIALASFSLTPFRQFKQVNHVKQKVKFKYGPIGRAI